MGTNPRTFLREHGALKLAELLKASRYVISDSMLEDCTHVLRSSKPWLIEGQRGCGKTQLAESLADAFGLRTFYLQGMGGLTRDDVLYVWDRDSQTHTVKQALAAGFSLPEAQAAKNTREHLRLGEALAAFEYAATSGEVPLLIIDEIDKIEERVEDMLLQLFGRGFAHIPNFGEVGIRDRSNWPIVILLSNDLRHDLSAPLRSRCLYSWIDPPTPKDEVLILTYQVPDCQPHLLKAVVKMLDHIRHDMPNVRDKPGLRESIDLLTALTSEGISHVTEKVIIGHLCFMAKKRKELENLRQGSARLSQVAQRPNREIDSLVDEVWNTTEKGMASAA